MRNDKFHMGIKLFHGMKMYIITYMGCNFIQTTIYICTQYCVDICNLTVFSDPLSRGVFEQRNEFIIYFTCTHI